MPIPILKSRGGAGKKNLPLPYNQDLSGVLLHLNRRQPEARAKLANELVTASYLRAGMALLDQHLGPGGKCTCRKRHESRQDNAVKALINAPDFVQAVHDTAYWHVTVGMKLPPARMSLALMASAEADRDITAAISKAYEDYIGSWEILYQAVMNARGLRLRPGLTLSDLANALSAANDGIILRAIGDPQAGVLDQESRKTLMGHIALAIIYAFLEPKDDTDGLTLEQAVAARF